MLSGSSASSADTGSSSIASSPFTSTSIAAWCPAANGTPGRSAPIPAFCASSTSWYSSRCRGVNSPLTGSVRVMSAV